MKRNLPLLAIGAAACVGLGYYALRSGKSQSDAENRKVLVVWGTETGHSRSIALECCKSLAFISKLKVETKAMRDFDPKEVLTTLKKYDHILFFVSTWDDGTPAPKAVTFFEMLDEAINDPRVSNNQFENVSFSVGALGSSEYPEYFCKAGHDLMEKMQALGAESIIPVVEFDEALDMEKDTIIFNRMFFKSFLAKYCDELGSEILKNCIRGVEDSNSNDGSKKKLSLKAYRKRNRKVKEAKQKLLRIQQEQRNSELTAEDKFNEQLCSKEGPLGDIEDLADEQEASKKKREMATMRQKRQLKKEGYKLVGTHSAVKLCRWTKHHLRGQGGCYKHTFYGITSAQCMEATPSLACANRCTFCWRHHANPVGREWRWKADPPTEIVKETVDIHLNMVRQLKGMDRVIVDRFNASAAAVRHCALSLVGEPIMYPHINEYCQDLHDRHISTFLVTNAQFPAELRDLQPVTQLYLSIDAPTPEQLKTIDRPLFPDYWDRFMDCVDIIKTKPCCRSTFRLTLLQGDDENMNVEPHADIICRGTPSLVEIKAVTYSGDHSITLKDVPFYKDVRAFGERLCELVNSKSDGIEYGLACEHEHSCCLLLARKDVFYKDDKWHTWIDFDKFFELEKNYRETGEEFTPQDYAMETPDWCRFGAVEAGFDPKDERFKKIRRHHNKTTK
eukprot:TRINITY_DN28813_c0_g1_i1.p1 TRINITY_DN28813_c0_g1~~TRINITY_DN28813_c0_g1_i1.p1  ORF type:complete len:675 (+),score=200.50 TRINITY_DN28813_c0_g1_i1:26-2050(+)